MSLDEQLDLPIVVQGSGSEVVVFGPPSVLERLGEQVRELPGPVIRAARHAIAGASDVVAQASEIHGAYIKLTEEAQELLALHEQAVSSTGLLGFVRSGDGTIAGQLTFEPAANVLTAAPSLAGAAALQLQMAAIEKRLDRIHTDLGYLIEERHIDVEAETVTNLDILSSVFGEVMATSELTTSQWDRTVNIEASVRQVFKRATLHLESIQQALDRTTGSLGERVKSLQELLNQDRTEQWLQLYGHADRAMTQWELLHLYRQLDEHPDRAEELSQAVRERVIARFAVLRELADTLARLLDAEHDARWYDRIRLISKNRLDELLVDLAQILDSYRQGVTDIQLANTLALGAGDVACEGLDMLGAMTVAGDTIDADERSLFDALRDSTSRIPIVGRDRD